MNKNRLYILTFSAIAIVTLLAGLMALRYFYSNAKQVLLEQKMQSGQREIRELGILLEQQLQYGTPSAKVIENLQQSILNTDAQSEFVCMYDTSGIELCHPDPSLVGMKIDAGNSSFSTSGKTQSFQYTLKNGRLVSGIRDFPDSINRNSEIVSVYPVKGTDWMLASHTNIKALQTQLEHLYQRFLTGTLLLIIILTASCFWLIRMIYRVYEKEMDLKISGLNDEVNHLGMLNKQLEIKQQNVIANVAPQEKNTRKRLITYYKDEIMTIDMDDVAYIALNENVVSALTFRNKMYTVNSSLDDLMKQVDNDVFYRANRQYIVNINAIESILIYGRNQLRIKINPPSPEAIIISKNKVSEFKKWLDR